MVFIHINKYIDFFCIQQYFKVKIFESVYLTGFKGTMLRESAWGNRHTENSYSFGQ